MTLLVQRGTAVAVLLVIAWQFVTAGEFIGSRGDKSWIVDHAVGTIVLHVVAGLAVVAAVVHRRADRGASSTAIVLAVVVFAASFAQAWFGSHGVLALHVPVALALTVAACWLAAAGSPRVSRRAEAPGRA